MSKNVKVISTAKEKTNPYKYDELYGHTSAPVDPMGMWNPANRFGPVVIPGNTMATHGYGNIPLWVVPDNGPGRMVMPNTGNQTFSGATSFTEYPMAKTMAKGGAIDPDKARAFLEDGSIYGHPLTQAQITAFAKAANVQVDEDGNIIEDEETGEPVAADDESYEQDYEKKGGSTHGRKTKKNIKSSVNKLMLRNETLFGPYGRNEYDPSVERLNNGWLDKYQTGGGTKMPYVHYQDGGTVSEIWEQVTGKPWSEAHRLGLTDGSYEANIQLRDQLLTKGASVANVTPVKAKKTVEPAPAASPLKSMYLPMDYSGFKKDETAKVLPGKEKAAERNAAAVKQAKESSAATLWQEHMERQELQSKYPGKSAEDIKRIQQKMQSPWMYEPAGQLASYLTRGEGLSEPEMAAITGEGTMGNRLGVASNIGTWGLANEVGANLVGRGIGYAAEKAPVIWSNLKSVAGDLPGLGKKIMAPIDKTFLRTLASTQGVGDAFAPAAEMSALEKYNIEQAKHIGDQIDRLQKPSYIESLVKGQGYTRKQAVEVQRREIIKTLHENLERNPDLDIGKSLEGMKEDLPQKYLDEVVNAKPIVPKNAPDPNFRPESKGVKIIDKVHDISGVKPSMLNYTNVQQQTMFGKPTGIQGVVSKYGIKPAFERQYMPLPTAEQQAIMNTNTVMDNLYAQQVSSPSREMLRVMRDVQEQPKGFMFKGANSLSSDSFGLYTRAAKAAVKDGKVQPRFLGYNYLNTSGHASEYGVDLQTILKSVNDDIKAFNQEVGKKYKLPNAFIKDNQIVYPDMGLIKNKLGGLAFPQMPTADQFFTGFPFTPEYKSGGWLDTYQLAGPTPGPAPAYAPVNIPKQIIPFDEEAYAASHMPATGVVVDKWGNTAYYTNNKGESGSFPVLTGKNVNLNKNVYGVDYLESHPELRNTPVGNYLMKESFVNRFKNDIPNFTGVSKDYYNYLMRDYKGKFRDISPISAYGQPAPLAKDLGLHRIYADNASNPNDPEYVRRMSKLQSPNPRNRAQSFGCVNCEESAYDILDQYFPKEDTLQVIDSRKANDLAKLLLMKKRLGIKQIGGTFTSGISTRDNGWLDNLE